MFNFLNLHEKLGLYLLQKRYRKYFNKEKDTQNRNNLIIEFMGPPGVGKTTYSKALAESMNSRSPIISSKDIHKFLNTKVRKYIDFTVFHELLFKDILLFYSSYKGLINNKLKQVRFELTQLECDALSTQFNGIVINDEGIGHYFTNFLTRTITSDESKLIADVYLNNRLIIFLDAPKEIVLSRVKERERKQNYTWDGHKGMTDNEIIELTQNELQEKMELYNQLLTIKQSAIIILDTQKSLADNIEIIKKTIKIT